MKATWSEGQYNCYKYTAAGFEGSAVWDCGGYVGRFEHWKLKAKFSYLESAKKAVEKLAMQKCEELLASLVVAKEDA